MSPPRRAYELPVRHSGAALVAVLLLLVGMLVVILAVFSRAQLDRQTSAASAANLQSEILADTAVELIVGDLFQEIAAGSKIDDLAKTNSAILRKFYEPICMDTAQTMVGTNAIISTAPSMVIQRVVPFGSQAPANLAKQSLRHRPFFAITGGYFKHVDLGAIPDRASAVSTTASPLAGRAISTNRWNLPHLTTTGETLQPPDWIYLNRQGKTPTTFTKSMALKTTANDEYVIGRFAYNIYDTGGLIDINLVGNPLAAEHNVRRGRLHQVSLANAPAPLAQPDFAQFVSWRSAGESAGNLSDVDTPGGLFDAKRAFTRVKTGSQAFVTRQDLLRYVSQTNLIGADALPFLATFSRELNAPSYTPDPNRPLLPADPSPDLLNPSLASARFSSETVLSRGSDPDVTVPAGTPTMFRRFPLSKLSLLSEETPDPDTIRYYFGLRKNADGAFDYVANTSDGRIARLSEVANLGREPNFFELLQAAITTGSLGRHAGNSYTVDFPRDSLRNLQIMQIGANIIDQWDEDDLPTTLRYPDATGGWLNSYGTENLPYLNNFVMVPHHPVWDRKRLQVWGLFDVWNPHHNATTPPKDISGFRIRAVGGKGSVSLRYELAVRINGKSQRPYGPLWSPDPNYPEDQNILTLNPSPIIAFAATGNYSEPTIVGGSGSVPSTASDRPGFLMWEGADIPPAIPQKSDRTQDLQRRLNTLMDNEFPYLSSEDYNEDAATGDRIYPAGTTISDLNSTYWTQSPASPSPADPIRIYANYPVKAYNWFRYSSAGYPNKTTFELQYQDSRGQWHTYQVLNQFMPRSAGGEENTSLAGHTSGTPTLLTSDFAESWKTEPATWWKDTHHSVPGFDDTKCFYGWREPTWMISFFKLDPRTIRFGYYPTTYADVLGTTIRTSPEPLPSLFGSQYTPVGDSRWRILTERTPGLYEAGVSPNLAFGPSNFEWLTVGQHPSERYAAMALMINPPDGALSATEQNVGRYADLDGVTRAADGYLGALPTVPGRTLERPTILNRPFRSVGEMGYAFRDMPWKSLDFFSKNSGDLGLLDAFSLEETEGDNPVVAGKVNLNSASSKVLQALLTGSGDHADLPSKTMTDGRAATLSESIRAAATNAPFRDRGDLVRRVLGASAMALTNLNANPGYSGDLARTKIQQETAIRTLSGIGSTRTWNLLVDLVVQTGRFTSSSRDLADFVVQAERHCWIHLAIDRLTGEVVGKQTEQVNE